MGFNRTQHSTLVGLDMEFIDVNGTRYVVKKKFELSDVKNIDILNEMKWWWGGDFLIRNPTHNKLLVAQKIDDIEFVEEELTT